MLRKLFLTFVSVAAGFLNFVPTQVIAVDNVFVSLTDIADNPDTYMGKTLTTKVFIEAVYIMPKKIFNLSTKKEVFDGALLIVKDGNRKGSELFGNMSMIDENNLNIVMKHKKMARDLKDALTQNQQGYNCTATVTIEKQAGRHDFLGTVMVIHAIEAQTTGGAVKIAESMYPK